MMTPIYGLCFLALAVMAAEDVKQLETLLHDGNNKFTSNMFTEVSKKNPKKSFVISGYSVLTPLAQLGIASVGESHDEILEAIGMPNDNVTKEVFSAATAKVRSVKGVTLTSASKIYVANQYALNDEFAAMTRSTFGSEVQNIDFGKAAAAAKEVNTWVEAQTNNRIKDLVDPDSIGDDTRALLVNALYFKGMWDAQFDKALTTEKNFHVNKIDTVKVDMMYRKGDYKYADSSALKSQIVEIPYKGGETSLVVVLPHDIEGITEVQEMLKNPTVLEEIVNKMYTQEVNLYLPKFKIETTTDLKEILKEMNIKRMFDPTEARLDNLLKEINNGLYIDSAIQKAFIEVNEEGAEAGAANVYESVNRSLGGRSRRVEFKADHPFLFYLFEGNNMLFSGVYSS